MTHKITEIHIYIAKRGEMASTETIMPNNLGIVIAKIYPVHNNSNEINTTVYILFLFSVCLHVKILSLQYHTILLRHYTGHSSQKLSL